MADYSGKVFGLAHKRCVFVEAIIEDANGGLTPVKPKIIDKKTGPHDVDLYQEHLVNDTGAFILHFVLERVDSNQVAQIYMSEYGVTDQVAAKKVVNDFIEALLTQKLLKEIPRVTKTPGTPQVTKSQKFTGLYNLSFDVNLNQMGSYRIKIFT